MGSSYSLVVRSDFALLEYWTLAAAPCDGCHDACAAENTSGLTSLTNLEDTGTGGRPFTTTGLGCSIGLGSAGGCVGRRYTCTGAGAGRSTCTGGC
eukprot:857725-Rhodomonas_salina.1